MSTIKGELILLVDDEPNIIQLAQMYLERDGFRVHSVSDGRSALDAARRVRPALIVLDVMLPVLDGLEVCRKLRAEENPVPILMLTARDEDVDKIIGLEFGADDYLTKPFNPRELVARIRAILRRSDHPVQPHAKPIYIGNLVLDPARREVTVGDTRVYLRTQEFDLLRVFIEHKGLVLSREQILALAWGYDYFGETRTVDVHVGHLRKKLVGSSAQIETVIGVGYKLVE